jgi:hypothetical protein
MRPVGVLAAAIVTCLLLGGVGQAAASPVRWCEINPPHPREGAAVEIATTDVHVVRKEQQPRAKELLRSKPFIHLTREEALNLVKNPSLLATKGDGQLYLIRASAFGVDDQFDVGTRLQVYAFLNDRALEVVNSSLSDPGMEPVNFGVVVRVAFEVRELDIACLTAS